MGHLLDRTITDGPRLRKNRGGFAVWELLAGVVVIAIIASITLPRYTRHRLRARRVEARLKLASMATALAAFKREYGTYASCFGNMGLHLTSGYYGINAKALVDDRANHNARAREQGADCPDVVSAALVVGRTAFPPSRWSGRCDRFYQDAPIGFIRISDNDQFYVNIAGYVRNRCSGNEEHDFSKSYELWELNDTGNSLEIAGPATCVAGTFCAAHEKLDQ
jgi:type II secretory pathway pseudopilin PulG